MPELAEADVAAWFAPIRLTTRQNNWPPALRQIERAPTAEAYLDALGATLGELAGQELPGLAQNLAAGLALEDLQTILAQLGAARLLRVTDWLVSGLPEGSHLLTELTRGRASNARAICSSLRALTARATLTRMFGPDRVAELQFCAEAAFNRQENL